MNSLLKPWIVISLFLFALACNSENNRDVVFENIDAYKIDPLQAKPYSIKDLVTDYKFISIELPDSLQFAGVRKVLFKESHIYILDISSTGSHPKIYAFDSSGSFEFAIDKPGRGPGEYEYIYDFDITEDMIVASTPINIQFYDRFTGSHIKSNDNRFDDNRINSIYLFNNETGVTAAGRNRGNRSLNHFKFFDVNTNAFFHEEVSFPSHALRFISSYRNLFETDEGLRARPENSNIIYSIQKNTTNDIIIEPEYFLDFGDLWVPESFLKTSFQQMDRIFNENLADEFVHTVDIFENSNILYATYPYKGKQYAYLFDKRIGKQVNFSALKDNHLGWPLKPVSSFDEWVVGVILPFELSDEESELDPALQEIIDSNNDEGSPILVLAKFGLNQ